MHLNCNVHKALNLNWLLFSRVFSPESRDLFIGLSKSGRQMTKPTLLLCSQIEDSGQPEHFFSLIEVFAVLMMKA